jgi:hypothetical protein
MAGHQNYSVKGDRALSSGDEDKLGFREVAKRITTSLVDRASVWLLGLRELGVPESRAFYS